MSPGTESSLTPSLASIIRIEAVYTRSINLTRDGGALDLIAAYRPTSRSLQSLQPMVAGLTAEPAPRALAAIGPYGVGKSAFALFAAALLSDPQSEMHQTAAGVLRGADGALADQIDAALAGSRGYLRVAISGLPDSLQRQLLLALAVAAEQGGLDQTLIDHLLRDAETDLPMSEVLKRLEQVQRAWAHRGGRGVLIEIDELGKFLEHAAFHPERRELHLLQLLAEHSRDPEPIPVQLLVLLHQAFEHYGARLGQELRDEWHKVQGRFETIAFIETAEQALRVMASAFVREGALPQKTRTRLEDTTAQLAREGALPHGLDAEAALDVFDRCYPLHPVSVLILPLLCQKVAQNERTLFSYLGSGEPFGLQERLRQLSLGQWIGPWDLYDYFILNQNAALSDGPTQHRWAEVVAALERLEIDAEDPEGAETRALRALLKTIGLLNLIGAQRGLKASRALLDSLFESQLDARLQRLAAASVIHFRQFSQDYRVWAGSDFDLHAACEQARLAQSGRSLASTLNALHPLKPIIARRATIDSGNLRVFTPRFAAAETPPKPPDDPHELTLWFYLDSPREPRALDGEQPAALSQGWPDTGVLARCPNSDPLRDTIDEWMALRELPKYQAALHQDPVAAREHRAWLSHAEQQAQRAIHDLLAAPETLHWSFAGANGPVVHPGRRAVQEQLSGWVEQRFPHSPKLNNELINRDAPSSAANLGRKRLIAAMLSAADQPELGIKKTPAEKSLYLNLLAATGLHRVHQGRLGLHAPDPQNDPCRLVPLWQAITNTLGDGGQRQVPLPELYDQLRRPPFGVKLGPLPVLIIAYLIIHQREVALYQEGRFCDSLRLDQAELLGRRPELFALERYSLGGWRGKLFERYLKDIIGPSRRTAEPSLLDIVRELAIFLNRLPEYSLHTDALSPPAKAVRRALAQATSPGALLFRELPRACAVEPDTLNGDEESAPLKAYLKRLIAALRELNQAYPALLQGIQRELEQRLLAMPQNEASQDDLGALRQAVVRRYQGLDAFTEDQHGLGAFIKRLCSERAVLKTDKGKTDQNWLESVATLLASTPPKSWRDASWEAARLRLGERATQLRELERLRSRKRLDQLSDAQRQQAREQAADIGKRLLERDPAERQAVLDALIEQLASACNALKI